MKLWNYIVSVTRDNGEVFSTGGGRQKYATQSEYPTIFRRKLIKWENFLCISLELMTIFGFIKEGKYKHRKNWGKHLS